MGPFSPSLPSLSPSVVGGWLSRPLTSSWRAVGQKSHPTCHFDTLGGRWSRSRGESGKKPTQRVKSTRWVVVGIIEEGSRARKPPNVSSRHVGWSLASSWRGVGQKSHPTCQDDTLGVGRWLSRELGKKATQRVKSTRWVVVGVVVQGSRPGKPPNVSR